MTSSSLSLSPVKILRISSSFLAFWRLDSYDSGYIWMTSSGPGSFRLNSMFMVPSSLRY